MSGYAARIVSSQMLSQPIIAVSNDKKVSRALNILSGTKGVFCILVSIKIVLSIYPNVYFTSGKIKKF